MLRVNLHPCWLVAPMLTALASRSHGDGLIYRLPVDGAWVRYRYATEGTWSVSPPPGANISPGLGNISDVPVSSSGVLVLRSVGKHELNGETCRWIELDQNVEIVGKFPDPATKELKKRTEKRHIVMKMLVPETHLVSGSDPLAHVRILYFKDGEKAPELIEDEKAKQFEIDRFRPIFPPPAKKAIKSRKECVDTPVREIARLDCEKHTFDSQYEGPLARGRRGWWSWRGKHEVWLNDKVPFGVVALKLTGQSHEWSGEKDESTAATVTSTTELVVAGMDVGAKSELRELELGNERGD